MPTFSYKGRKTSEILTGTVEAETREAAIAQITAMAAPGEEFDVMQVQEGPTGGGATGTQEPPALPEPAVRLAGPGHREHSSMR